MLANKIDVPKAASEAEMACELGLQQLQWSVGADGQAGVRLFPCAPRQASLLLSAVELANSAWTILPRQFGCPSKNDQEGPILRQSFFVNYHRVLWLCARLTGVWAWLWCSGARC
eukprot:COSAG04_NODE_3081_length_3189_cov_2.765372_1_plen_115_part_00